MDLINFNVIFGKVIVYRNNNHLLGILREFYIWLQNPMGRLLLLGLEIKLLGFGKLRVIRKNKKIRKLGIEL
jgi:hypothetical protein